jgi:S-adenosylmethionine-diacylglycerol 3-amino-3-carboxypropyl transferase
MKHSPDELKNDDWLDYVSRFPVAFAQVREDANVDSWIASNLQAGSRGIMIGSGGCTAALLASMNKFESLTLVDMNRSQLDLAKAKISFLRDYEPIERLDLLGHSHSYNQQGNLSVAYSAEFRRIQIREDAFGPISTVSKLGLDYVGRYELLFARLQYVLSEPEITKSLLCLDSPQEQVDFMEAHPEYMGRLEMAFNEVMVLPNLVRLFGVDATQNSVVPFSEHFLHRTRHVIQTLPAASNPYLAQLLSGKFKKDVRYPWLDLPRQDFQTQIEYRLSAMLPYLSDSNDLFDFIHLSNIVDWLSEHDARALLELASMRLRKGGWLIVRQLNSDLPLKALCQSLSWQRETGNTLHANDRSFFYKDIHVAIKE